MSALFFYDVLDGREVLARESVYDKLEKAACELPKTYYLKIHSAFRPRTEQMQLWNCKLQEIRSVFPNLNEEDIIVRTKRLVADPRSGFGGHQTGGAIDVTLCDAEGNDYDMGSEISGMGGNVPTHSKKVTAEVRHNRAILLSALTKAGFVNYPKEWWHFCYGDRMWAAYKNKPYAIYGEAK